MAGMVMQLKDGKGGRLIRNVSDLRGSVQIESAKQALDYVRFVRSPGIWPFLFERNRPVVEITPRPLGSMAPKLLYDDAQSKTRSGWDGVVSGNDWKRLKFHEPLVERTSKGWSVNRAGLALTKNGYAAGWLVETVTPDGGYVFSVREEPGLRKALNWFISIPANQ